MNQNLLGQVGNANASADSTWFLTGCVELDGLARHIPINTMPFQIGRNPGLGLRLPSGKVSKLHAEIVGSGEVLYLRDLGSTNGTYLNGEKVNLDSLIAEGDLLQFADMEFRMGRMLPESTDRTLQIQSIGCFWMLSQFNKLISDQCVIPFFQPIISLTDKEPIGFEVLARSNLDGLEYPTQMFSTAERLSLEGLLSTICRSKGVLVGQQLRGAPRVFVNTHPAEDLTRDVLPSLQELRKVVAEQPLTLEVHEAAITDRESLRDFIVSLRELGIKLAYDDFGAGQSRLMDLVEFPPDYLKFDIRLIRGIHNAQKQRRTLVGMLVRMVRDFGIAAVAEGIECEEEALVCQELGFDYAQGYYFGRPSPVESYL